MKSHQIAMSRAPHCCVFDSNADAMRHQSDPAQAIRHSFTPIQQDGRFTIHPNARAEILARLLALNHQRYAEEVAAGLHDNRKSPSKAKGTKNTAASRSTVSASDSSPESDGLFEDE
jgi:hypothetical protein